MKMLNNVTAIEKIFELAKAKVAMLFPVLFINLYDFKKNTRVYQF